jgi:hypothetical protein
VECNDETGQVKKALARLAFRWYEKPTSALQEKFKSRFMGSLENPNPVKEESH